MLLSLVTLTLFPSLAWAWFPYLPLEGQLLPLPTKMVYSSKNRTVYKGQISFDLGTLSGCDVLEYAKKTYEGSWLIQDLPNAQSVDDPTPLTVQVKIGGKCPDKNQFPQHGMIENYTLTIPDDGDVLLEAATVWGALRGIETFSQLIFPDNGSYYLRTVHIKDGPVYPHRGLLIDSARHFLTVATIKRTIDLLSINKMNVLHWHLVDSESFPYDSEAFPELAKQGAYTPYYKYSIAEIKDIVYHAKLRGVRVIAEFDTPGHMASWKGIPGLMTDCGGVPNVLDPSSEATFEFLEKFFAEVRDVFPEALIHLGGDEIAFFSQCWQNNSKVRAFMEEKGWGNNITGLINYYLDRFQGVIDKIYDPSGKDDGSNLIFWDEIFAENNPRANAIAHLWRGRDLIANVTAAGHRVLVSDGWYLDHIKGGEDWTYMYSYRPRDFAGTAAQKQLVIGGEAAMWGEFVDDTNLEPTVWPRTSAVAERLWSDPSTAPIDAIPRMHEHQCRAVARGFFVRPAWGPGFCPTIPFIPYKAF